METTRSSATAKWLRSEWGYPDRTLTCSKCGYEYEGSKNGKQKVLPHCPGCGRKMRLG